MTFKPGQSGNPRGRLPEKQVADAIRVAVSEDDPKTGKRKLRVIADKLVAQAMAGEMWAIGMIADRLDGKPATEQTVTVNDNRDRLSDDELRHLLASAMAAVTVDDRKLIDVTPETEPVIDWRRRPPLDSE